MTCIALNALRAKPITTAALCCAVGAIGCGGDDSAPPTEPPLEPLFSIGTIGVGFDEDRDLVLLQFEEPSPEADEDLTRDDEPETVRVWSSRTRLRSLARHAAGVVASGRPTCELCGFPKDEDHVCPRSNGHSRKLE